MQVVPKKKIHTEATFNVYHITTINTLIYIISREKRNIFAPSAPSEGTACPRLLEA